MIKTDEVVLKMAFLVFEKDKIPQNDRKSQIFGNDHKRSCQ